MKTNQPLSGKRKIFISYRVRDSQSATGRIADALLQHFDEDQIFMDVDKLSPGADFTEVIPRYLDSCYVMLVIIGPDWAGPDVHSGRHRILDPDDWVRREISRALERNILVIPVLVEDGSMPSAQDLPDELLPLLRRQAYEISNKKWKADVAGFIDFLKKNVGIESRRPAHTGSVAKPAVPATVSKPVNWKNIVITAFAVIGLLAIIGIFVEQEEPVAPDPQPIYPAHSSSSEVLQVAGTYVNDFGGKLIIQQQQTNLQIYVYNPDDGLTYGPAAGVLEGDEVRFSFQENGYLLHYKARLQDNGHRLSSMIEIAQGAESYSKRVEFYRE